MFARLNLITLGRLNLMGTALVFWGFGAWALLTPAPAAAVLGLGFANQDGPTAIRAIYGGYEIGAGVLFAYSAANAQRVLFGLVAILAIIGPILAARLLGLWIDGVHSAAHPQRVAMEIVGLGITAVLLALSRTPSKANPADVAM
jgi:Domain of unknown function (DUF4345)